MFDLRVSLLSFCLRVVCFDLCAFLDVVVGWVFCDTFVICRVCDAIDMLLV